MRECLDDDADEEHAAARDIGETGRDIAVHLLPFVHRILFPEEHREDSEERNDHTEERHMEGIRHPEAERVDEPDEHDDQRNRDERLREQLREEIHSFTLNICSTGFEKNRAMERARSTDGT